MGGLMGVAGTPRASRTAHHSPTLNPPGLECAAANAIRAAQGARMRWSCARDCQCCRPGRPTSFDGLEARVQPKRTAARPRSLRNARNRWAREKRGALSVCACDMHAQATVGNGSNARVDSSAVVWTVRCALAGNATKPGCGPHVQLACIDRVRIKALLRVRRPASGNTRRPGERGDDCSWSASSSCIITNPCHTSEGGPKQEQKGDSSRRHHSVIVLRAFSNGA